MSSSFARWPLLLLLLPTAAQAFNIVVDAGHGGTDPGALGCNLREADVTLDVALRLRDLLAGAGQTVSLTRSTDVFVPLSDRADFANSRGANRFVSIHNNSFSEASANGTETYCHTSGGASIAIRDVIQTKMIAAWALTNRGGKTANFTVLAETDMPATLSEIGFITNCARDATFLASTTHRQEAAQAHLDALAQNLGFNGTAQTGTLQGFVVINDGQPISVSSVRIPGARVTIVDRTDTDVADNAGFWSFALPAGNYVVRAEADGYLPAQATCQPLAAGAERFCSVALVADVASEGEGEGEGEGEDPGEGEGEGEGEDPGEGEGEGEDPGEGEGEDPGEGEGEGETPSNRIVIRNKPGASGGCSCDAASDNGAALPAVAGLLMLGLLRRRRSPTMRAMLPLCAFAFALVSTSAAAAPAIVAPPIDGTMVEQHRLKVGAITLALPSSDGARVLISDAQFEGLAVVDPRTGKQVAISDDSHAGLKAVWVGNTVARRAVGAPFGGQPLLLLDATTGAVVGPWTEHPTHVVKQVDDVVVFGRRLDEAGNIAAPVQLSPASTSCFMPQLATRAADVVIVFQCLGQGIWLDRLAARGNDLVVVDRVRIDVGTSATLAADGRTLVYNTTSEDGHATLGADIVVVDLDGDWKKLQPIRSRTRAIERSPGVSNVRSDGSRVVAAVVDNDLVTSVFMPKKR